MTLRTGELSALGIRTRVVEAGPAGAHEAVVMLHGSPGSADVWRDLLARTGAFARAVAFDLPGFGDAARPADWEYSPSAYATFVAGALSELGVHRAHLVMSDVGGSGILWAATHPEAFASAVLIDSGALIGYRWHVLARLHRAPAVGAALPRLDRPALVLWGARDRFVPAEQAQRQRESFPRARVVVLEDRGHYLHVEDPEGVAAEAVPFLREQLGA
jgi:pimeloyl-ACP methyl ester carboxylesterase